MYFLVNMGIFYCYVSLPEGIMKHFEDPYEPIERDFWLLNVAQVASLESANPEVALKVAT